MKKKVKKFDVEWQQFQLELDGNFQLKVMQEMALSGKLDGYPSLRSIFWRFFLDILHVEKSEWISEMTKERLIYSQLREKYFFVQEKLEIVQALPSEIHPLSSNEQLLIKSSWNATTEDPDMELKKLIMQDVERTQEFIQQQMLDILYVYCKLNPDISYRQGMHEILAPFLFVIHSGYVETVKGSPSYQEEREEEDKLPDELYDLEFAEHDAFSLFSRVMVPMKPLYLSADTGRTQPFDNGFHLNTPIIKRCHGIQNSILKLVDYALFQHLKSLEIEPQLFGLRWIRLMFGREFSFDQIFRLWDILLSFHDRNFSFLDWIAVAILKSQRDFHLLIQVLAGDYSIVLQRMMKYPCDLDPVDIGNLAIQLREKYSHLVSDAIVITHSHSESPFKSLPTSRNTNGNNSPQQPFSWVKNTPKLFSDLKKSFEPVFFSDKVVYEQQNEQSINTLQTLWNVVEEQVKSLDETRVLAEEAQSIFETRVNNTQIDFDSFSKNNVDNDKRLLFILKTIRMSIESTINSLSSMQSNHSTSIVENDSLVKKSPRKVETPPESVEMKSPAFIPKMSINDLMAEVETFGIEPDDGVSAQKSKSLDEKLKFQKLFDSNDSLKTQRKKKLRDLLK